MLMASFKISVCFRDIVRASATVPIGTRNYGLQCCDTFDTGCNADVHIIALRGSSHCWRAIDALLLVHVLGHGRADPAVC